MEAKYDNFSLSDFLVIKGDISCAILVPRAHDLSGLRQRSRSLAGPYFQSAIHEFPVVLRRLRPKSKMDENVKMAESDQINLFHEALDFGLEILSIADWWLKEKQYDVEKCVVLDNKDVLAVLPTGYVKSLICQLLQPVFNVMAHGGKPEGEKSTVIIISPLNALIQDQMVKMRVGGLSVCVLRGDRVATEDDNDEISIDVPTKMLSSGHFDLIFTHLEMLVENKKVSKLLKMPAFKEKVKAVIVDEAHLVVDWYVHFVNVLG